jgi:hypothetical protein
MSNGTVHQRVRILDLANSIAGASFNREDMTCFTEPVASFC